MSKIDKYKIAAEIKKENPTMTHRDALEIAKIAEELCLEYNWPLKEAIEKAKEMISNENIEKMEKAN